MFPNLTRVLPLAAAVMFPAVGWAAQPEPDAQPVELAWKWHKGETARYRMTVRHEEKVEAGDLPPRQSRHHEERVWRYVVEDVDEHNGGATLRVTYESIRLDYSEGAEGPAVRYDSRTEHTPAHPALLPLAAIVGRTFTMKVDAHGHVQSLDGLDSVLEEKAAETEDINPVLAAHYLESRQHHGDDASREQMEGWMRVLPEMPVEPGQKWEVPTTSDPSPLGTLRLDKAATFRQFQDHEGEPAAVIEHAGTYELTEEGRQLGEDQSVRLTEGTQQAAFVFSTKRGRLLKSENVTSLALEILQGPMRIVQVVKTSVAMDLLEDEQGAEAPEAGGDDGDR
jgi:hypothetical protein